MGCPRWLVALVVVAWCGAIAWGLRVVYAHTTTPGAQGDAAVAWPADAPFARATDNFTLVMFVHPDCPCTASSLEELRAVVHDAARSPAIVFVVGTGGSSGADWHAGDDLAGARRVLDPDGAIARRFGAETSGHVVLYDAGGRLRFAGGITGSRAHAGDNVGRRAVLAALADTGAGSAAAAHPVFGCALADEGGS